MACLFYILFESGILFGRANAVFSRFCLTTMMEVWVMTTTIRPGAANEVPKMEHLWRHATDQGKSVKLFCDVELIVASCHR